MSDNPSAFPFAGDGFGNLYHAPGMTLRDWFAGQSLPAIVSALIESGANPDKITEKSAFLAYDLADAMLAERAKGTSNG